MTFLQNTLADANAPATLAGLINTALISNGYQFVENVVISTRTHKVYKNPAANNITGKDWYLYVAHTTTGAGIIGFYISEGYNSTTDKWIRAAFGNSTTAVPDATYYSRHGTAEFTLEDANYEPHSAASAVGNFSNRDVNVPSSSFAYWISITNNRVIYLGSADPTLMIYAGAFDISAEHAAVAGADAFPIVSSSLLVGADSASGGTALTRRPKSQTNDNWQTCFRANGVSLASALAGGFPNIPSGPQSMMTRRVVRVPIASGNVTDRALYGYLIDVVVAGATSTRGDTITADGATWVMQSATNQGCYMLKAI